MNTDAFSSGDIVRVHRQGELRWVVVGKVSDRKWRVIARDAIGRSGRMSPMRGASIPENM